MAEVVIALYRPHGGRDAEFRRLLSEHLPTLRRLQLVTDRPAMLLRAADGTYLEIFEWTSGSSARTAHDHPEVARIWERMEALADFVALNTLEESKRPFTHFSPIAL